VIHYHKELDMLRMCTIWGAAIVFAGLAASAHADVVVSPGNLNGWAFYTTNSSGIIGTGSGTGDFVTGPATPPLGTGSAHLATASGAGDGSVQLRNSSWAGTKIADLTSLSYSTYATAWNGQQLPYLTIWIDTDNNGSKDDRLWFEPAYSNGVGGNPTAGLNTWQTWNLLTGKWYSDNIAGPGSNSITLGAYLALKPNATIVNDAGQGIGGIRLATGFASAANNFNTYVDAFTIGTAGGTTTYNFEATAPVPEPGALVAWSILGTLGLAMTGWRRVRKS